MNATATSRRRFLAYFSTTGLASTLLPGTLWARMQEQEAAEVTAEMIRDAATLSGLELSEEQAQEMVEGVNRHLQGYAALRTYELDNSVAPPVYFSPLVPGMTVDRTQRPFRPTRPVGVRRPDDLEEVAFWPLTSLAELVRTRQVTSVELAEMYLTRLRRYNPVYNNVVTFTDDLAMAEARRADEELRAGRYRGLLHGLPWGAKDILAVRGYPTTWGSNAFKEQVTAHEASVVRLLREAGAVLIAKLTTGELAGGDRWFGGRTRNPWDPAKGSSGSSAGPASATVAGCVAFSIGTETSGSILSPSVACGATGLRPTYGRVSRAGAMTLRWTGDRLGPICRTVEDCAVVFRAIARSDEHDPSVIGLPFNWDAELDAGQYRVAYFPRAFEDDPGKGADWHANDQRGLDHLRGLGIGLAPVDVPLDDFATDALRALSAESTAAFDDFLRAGREGELGRPERANGWRVNQMVPAVSYLQAQRVRGVMMRQFSDALGDFDVYVMPYFDSRSYLEGTPEPQPQQQQQEEQQADEERAPPPPTATSQLFQLANHACYPAVAVPHGFGNEGLPTGLVFLGKPFRETEVLTVARAFQESTGYHRMRPDLRTG